MPSKPPLDYVEANRCLPLLIDGLSLLLQVTTPFITRLLGGISNPQKARRRLNKFRHILRRLAGPSSISLKVGESNTTAPS